MKNGTTLTIEQCDKIAANLATLFGEIAANLATLFGDAEVPDRGPPT